MQRRPSVPMWPHVGIVICLFVMSVLAVQAWRSIRPDARSSAVPTVASVTSEPARAGGMDLVCAKRFGATISAACVAPRQPVPEPDAPTAMVNDPAAPQPAAVRTARTPPTTVKPAAAKPAARTATPAEPSLPPPWTIRFAAQPVAARHAATPAPAPPKALTATPPSKVAPAHAETLSPWPDPVALKSQLENLRLTSNRDWAERVLAQLGALRRADHLASPQAAEALANLRTLELAAATTRSNAGPRPTQLALHRARYALRRRLDIWQTVGTISQQRGRGYAAPNTAVAAHRRRPYLPVRYDHLLRTAERFESTGSASARSELADQWDRLRFSLGLDEVRLAGKLDTHYRNANIRLAATQELINGLIPEIETSREPVFDRILGARVTGRSATNTRLLVRLVPDPRHVRFYLEARGIVASNTTSAKGPVTFFSNGQSTYLARKEFLWGRTGLRSMPAEAVAQSRNHVRDIQSDFDGILLVGSVVRSIARDQQQEQRDQLRAEVDGRVTHRARRRLDSESQQRLTVAQQRVKTRLIEPLRRLQLEPVALETRTTNRRIIIRGRLAGAHQLAAFTSRPQALANSQASVQVHQSLINNALEQMGLDGSRNDLRDLYRRMLDEIGRPDVPVADEVPRRVTIEFAPRDAVRVQFSDGRVTFELRIAELVSRSRKWRDFAVRVHYREQLDGLEVRLVRDGTIELKGQRLGIRNQFALRGIFTKVFGRDRVISVIPAHVARDPRFSSLEVCQWTIRDGWLAVAVAKKGQPRAQVAKSRSTARK